MQSAIDQFRANVDRVRNLGSLTSILGVQTTNALDLSDILRAELVLAVSAFDHYIHEIARLGMLEAYQGSRQRSQAFLRYQVSVASSLQGIADSANDGWLDREIRSQNGYRSFQHPDRIAEAVRLVSDAPLWSQVAVHTGMDAKDIRDRLVTIVNRRNQIAHEADMDPSYPTSRWPINDTMVNDVVDFLAQMAEAIFAVVS